MIGDPTRAEETIADLAERLRVAVARASAAEHDRDSYRIEADCAMRDYDDLELRFGQATESLQQIADRRPNRVFDPWASKLARNTLAEVWRDA